MILVIGTKNCSRCNAVKTILKNKKIEYTYQDINDLSIQDKNKYLEMAATNQMENFPLIIKDGVLISIQEVN